MSTGSKWYKRRKIITPTFHFKILERFCEVFDKESSVLVQCLEKHVGKGPIDVLPLVCACAMDIMCGKKSFGFG
jgi:cytochrome P450